MSEQITILSILGLEHSGTTLLVRILNNHPNAVAIGGMKNIGDFAEGRRTCSCGKASGECSWWKDVQRHFVAKGRQLTAVPRALETPDRVVIRDFLLAVADSSGKSLIVESSRQPSYLDLLPGAPDFASLPVHIFKHPCAQAWSAYRGGRSVLREMRRYRRRSRAILTRLADIPKAVHVSHEAFCAAPEEHLRRILLPAQLKPDPHQLETWGKKDLHIVGGNRMKKNQSSNITIEESWRNSLPLLHRLTAQTLGGNAYRRSLAAMRSRDTR